MLTVEHVKEFLFHVHEAECNTHGFRLAARDFFLSRDDKTIKPSDIGGEVGKIGRWKDAYADRPTLNSVLEYVKARSFQAYVYDYFMFKTATRANAARTEVLRDRLVQTCENTWQMEITDKGFHKLGEDNRLAYSKDLHDPLEQMWLEHGNNAFDGLNS